MIRVQSDRVGSAEKEMLILTDKDLLNVNGGFYGKPKRFATKGVCKGKCSRFEQKSKRPELGKKYCTTCEHYITTNHLICQCCKHKYRIRRRNLGVKNSREVKRIE